MLLCTAFTMRTWQRALKRAAVCFCAKDFCRAVVAAAAATMMTATKTATARLFWRGGSGSHDFLVTAIAFGARRLAIAWNLAFRQRLL